MKTNVAAIVALMAWSCHGEENPSPAAQVNSGLPQAPVDQVVPTKSTLKLRFEAQPSEGVVGNPSVSVVFYRLNNAEPEVVTRCTGVWVVDRRILFARESCSPQLSLRSLDDIIGFALPEVSTSDVATATATATEHSLMPCSAPCTIAATKANPTDSINIMALPLSDEILRGLEARQHARFSLASSTPVPGVLTAHVGTQANGQVARVQQVPATSSCSAEAIPMGSAMVGAPVLQKDASGNWNLAGFVRPVSRICKDQIAIDYELMEYQVNANKADVMTDVAAPRTDEQSATATVLVSGRVQQDLDDLDASDSVLEDTDTQENTRGKNEKKKKKKKKEKNTFMPGIVGKTNLAEAVFEILGPLPSGETGRLCHAVALKHNRLLTLRSCLAPLLSGSVGSLHMQRVSDGQALSFSKDSVKESATTEMTVVKVPDNTFTKVFKLTGKSCPKKAPTAKLSLATPDATSGGTMSLTSASGLASFKPNFLPLKEWGGFFLEAGVASPTTDSAFRGLPFVDNKVGGLVALTQKWSTSKQKYLSVYLCGANKTELTTKLLP